LEKFAPVFFGSAAEELVGINEMLDLRFIKNSPCARKSRKN